MTKAPKNCMTTASTLPINSTLTYEKVLEAINLIGSIKPISTNYAVASDVFKRKSEWEDAGFIFDKDNNQYECNGVVIKENKYLPYGMVVDIDEMRRQFERMINKPPEIT